MLSIVVITYGHEKYIRQALDSILMQKVDFEFEILIGEDCSPDRTRNILLEYHEKLPGSFRLFLRNENIGATKNLYDLFENCSGKYIAILEGDDYWTDTKKLQKQVDFLEGETSCPGVSHRLQGRDLEGGPLGCYPESSAYKECIDMDMFLGGYKFSCSALVFRRSFVDLLKKNRDVFCSNHIVGDFTLAFLLLTLGNVHIFFECMAVYRVRKDSNESNYNSVKSALQKYSDYVQVINANYEVYGELYDFSYQYTRRTISALKYFVLRGGRRELYQVISRIPLLIRLNMIWRIPYICCAIIFKRGF